MKKYPPGVSPNLTIQPLDPEMVRLLQRVCTALNFHNACTYKICRRLKRCSTREVMCWQVTREVIQPLVLWVRARDWAFTVAQGKDVEVAPVYIPDYQRILADDAGVLAEVKRRVEAAMSVHGGGPAAGGETGKEGEAAQ